MALLVDGSWDGEKNCERCRGVRIDPDVVGVAEAVAHVDIWDGCQASVVARPDPPAVAAIGYLTRTALENLDTVGWQIRDLLPRTLVLDYPAIENLVDQLATRITDTLGEAFASSARFTAIPRGGHIVLGMLSYALGLEPDQIGPRAGDDRPTVVVDDVAVTGLRFGEFLENLDSRQVVFAHLLSHPDLRSAIESRTPRVTACISAGDLHDHGNAHLGEAYEGWKRASSMPGRYWLGLPDHVLTPWSETDVGLWRDSPDEARLGIQFGWSTSLQRKWSHEKPHVPVHVQGGGRGPLAPTDLAIYGQIGGEVILGRTDGGSVVRLTGPAAELWLAIIDGEELESAVARLEPSAARHDELHGLVRRLVELRMLTPNRGDVHA